MERLSETFVESPERLSQAKQTEGGGNQRVSFTESEQQSLRGGRVSQQEERRLRGDDRQNKTPPMSRGE